MATTNKVLTVLEINAQTNQSTERELTADEIADFAALNQEYEQLENAENQKAAARESALAKLADLGLTAEEIAAL
jgi:hypothetical protein